MATQMTPLLHESSANLLIEAIKASFNTQLALLDNQYDDGINLEPLADEHIYISDKFEALDSPAVYILFGNMAFNYTDQPNYLEAANECVIVVSAQDVGADVLMKKMWRYGRVIYSALSLVQLNSADQRLSVKCVPKRLAYSEQKITSKLQQEAQKFRQDCVLELELHHFEKFLT